MCMFARIPASVFCFSAATIAACTHSATCLFFAAGAVQLAAEVVASSSVVSICPHPAADRDVGHRAPDARSCRPVYNSSVASELLQRLVATQHGVYSKHDDLLPRLQPAHSSPWAFDRLNCCTPGFVGYHGGNRPWRHDWPRSAWHSPDFDTINLSRVAIAVWNKRSDHASVPVISHGLTGSRRLAGGEALSGKPHELILGRI